MIYWHTGTGNSLYAATVLAQMLGEDMCRMTPGCYASASSCERVIWVFPIYSWGLPPMVKKFISRSVGLENARHYMVCTCGDDIGLAHETWRSLLRRKRWNARGAWSVQMPNNYVLLPGFDVDSSSLEQEKLSAAAGRLAEVARGIACGAKVDSVVRGQFPWIKTHVLYPLFARFMMSPKPFSFTGSCISCGKCAAVCPAANIRMENGHPCWGTNCTLCLGCYHICPVHAVAYGKATRGKGQYFIPKSMSSQKLFNFNCELH
jgi:ferredoxin